MPGDSRPDPSEVARARAARQARRAVHGVSLVIAVLFIGSSSLQIVRSVFGLDETTRAGDPCADGVARLTAHLDAFAACTPGGAGSPGGETARRAREISEAATVARTCAVSSQGLDTWAAFERARMARDQVAKGGGDPNGPRGVMHAPPLGDEAPPLPVDLR